MGGRYRNVMPSDLFKRGALARGSLPAPGKRYASENFRDELRILMRRCTSKLALHVQFSAVNLLVEMSQQAVAFGLLSLCRPFIGSQHPLMLAGTAAITVARSKAGLLGTIYRLTSKYGAAAKT